MNLSKSYEFFNPDKLSGRVHVVGCGSVGSTVAELLARFGVQNFVLYDFDIIKAHNIVNQMFTAKHVNRLKTDCLKEMLLEINPDAKIYVESSGWTDEQLDGYVFLAVDDIDLRRKIVEQNKYNPYVKAMFDFRTGLTDAQHFAADWSDPKQKKEFYNTMKFSHEEAQLTTQMSACQVSLCVAPTVRLIANAGVANFINFVKGKHLYGKIVTDAFSFMMEPIG